jgi:hypothetical protein
MSCVLYFKINVILTFLFTSGSVDLPSTPVPKRERLDSDSSTTSEKTENVEAVRELELETYPMMKPAPSGQLLKTKLLTVKKEAVTSNLKQGSRKLTTTGKPSRYYSRLIH